MAPGRTALWIGSHEDVSALARHALEPLQASPVEVRWGAAERPLVAFLAVLADKKRGAGDDRGCWQDNRPAVRVSCLAEPQPNRHTYLSLQPKAAAVGHTSLRFRRLWPSFSPSSSWLRWLLIHLSAAAADRGESTLRGAPHSVPPRAASDELQFASTACAASRMVPLAGWRRHRALLLVFFFFFRRPLLHHRSLALQSA